MQDSTNSAAPEPNKRIDIQDRPTIEGTVVREDDIESVKAIRAIVYLFRGMTILLLLLMVGQLISGISGAVSLSLGVVVAESVRLVIFAALLWVFGDLAALGVKSHYDIRASRILLARLAHTVCEIVESDDKVPSQQRPGSRGDSGV